MNGQLQSPKSEMRDAIHAKVTVITALYNGAPTLSRCIESVLTQDYPHVEYIVMDGGSSDGSVDILRGYGNRILWRSERDSGIYDAWTKALSLASGEWIAFIGADDFYLPGAIGDYMALARKEPVDYLSSLVRWVRPSGTFRIIGEGWAWPRFRAFMTTAHAGSMHHRSLFQSFGTYDLSYRYSGDYELLLRPQDKLRTAFLPKVTVEMQAGGASDSFPALLETRRAKVVSGGRNAALASVELCVAQAKLAFRRTLGRRSQ